VSELTSRVLIPWKGSGTLMNVGRRAGLKERGSRWRGGDLPKELELVQCGRKPYISCQETTCQDALGMHRPKTNKFRELSWYGLDVRVVTRVVRTPSLVVDALANGVEAGEWGSEQR